MSRLLCTCGKSYEVSAREPGTLVKCLACEKVLRIPAARLTDAVRTASERLRRARGEPCARHPKSLALDPCERCARWMCEACRAPAPSLHLCRDCAPAVFATEAIPVDFGILATPLIAARTVGRAFAYLAGFNLLATGIEWALAAPFLIIALWTGSQAALAEGGSDVLHAVTVAALACATIVISFFDAVFIPAADVVLLDRSIRRQAPDGNVIGAAFGRAWARKGTLALAFVYLALAVLGALVFTLPFILAGYLMGDLEIAWAGLAVAIPAAGTALGAFGLAIPVVILEHRTASQAFGRAWNLAQLRPTAAAFFGTAIVLVGVVLTWGLMSLPHEWGNWVVLAEVAATFLANMAWPAILVAAYHGLVAEEARVVGRRS